MSHNVVYFSSKANQIPLPGIANLPYTDVIVAFLVPKDGLNLGGAGGAFDHNLQSNIQALQSAGKNVLISFGGSKFPSSAYQSYALDVNGLVGQIVSFVTTHGFDGVDIDYEDDAGFRGGDPALIGTEDEGYITLSDMVNNVINPLIGAFGSQFGGVMGWQFADDGPPTYDQGGAWANGIGQALDTTGQPMI
jgi:chitinase